MQIANHVSLVNIDAFNRIISRLCFQITTNELMFVKDDLIKYLIGILHLELIATRRIKKRKIS